MYYYNFEASPLYYRPNYGAVNRLVFNQHALSITPWLHQWISLSVPYLVG